MVLEIHGDAMNISVTVTDDKISIKRPGGPRQEFGYPEWSAVVELVERLTERYTATAPLIKQRLEE